MAGESIREIERSLVEEKNWKYAGEVKASARPVNSLVDEEVDFETTMFNVPISNAQNTEVARYISQRFKEKTFDNYEFKEAKEKVIEEVYDAEALETDREVLELYDRIEEALRKLTDYGNDGFA